MSFSMLAWAQKVRTGSPATKSVLMALCSIVNDDGEGWPSQKRIADDCELSIRTVQRAMDDLEAAGFLSRDRRYRRDGYRSSDAIVIHTTPKILPDNMSDDTLSPDNVTDLTRHSVVAEPIIEPINDVVSVRKASNPEIEAAVSDWNAIAQEQNLAQVQKLTDKRRKHLKARLVDCGGLAGWRDCLGKIRGSPFLLGQQGNWRCDFDFVVSESGFTKIMEGKYDARPNSKTQSSITDALAKNRRELVERFGEAESHSDETFAAF